MRTRSEPGMRALIWPVAASARPSLPSTRQACATRSRSSSISLILRSLLAGGGNVVLGDIRDLIADRNLVFGLEIGIGHAGRRHLARIARRHVDAAAVAQHLAPIRLPGFRQQPVDIDLRRIGM